MNKKGVEMNTVGIIVIAAIAIIVVMTLIPTIATNMSALTTTTTFVNQTVTMPTAGNTLDLNGQAASGITLVNATGSGEAVPTTNYTIVNYVVKNGALVAQLKTTTSGYAGKSVNISYTAEPYGYDTNAGGRAIANLVVILAALAIAIVVITYVVRNDVFDF